MTGGLLTPDVGDVVTSLESRAQAFALAAHVHNDLEVGPVRLLPGLRMESVATRFHLVDAAPKNATLRTSLMPGLGVTAAVSPWAHLFAGAHRGFSPVAPGQSAEVRPESSWNYEAGVRIHPGFRLDLAGFLNDYKNLTGQCSFSSGCDETDVGLQFNGGRALIAGLESSMAHILYLPAAIRVPFQLSYTFTHTQFQSSFTSGFSQFGTVEAGDRLPYVPAHQAALQVTLEHPNLHLTLAGQLRSNMRDKAGPQGPISTVSSIPMLALMDASLAIPLTQRIKLYGTLTNLLNTHTRVSWRPMGARPTAPRQFMVGIKMQPSQ